MDLKDRTKLGDLSAPPGTPVEGTEGPGGLDGKAHRTAIRGVRSRALEEAFRSGIEHDRDLLDRRRTLSAVRDGGGLVTGGG